MGGRAGAAIAADAASSSMPNALVASISPRPSTFDIVRACTSDSIRVPASTSSITLSARPHFLPSCFAVIFFSSLAFFILSPKRLIACFLQ